MNIKFITNWMLNSEDPTVQSVEHHELALCGQGRAEGSASGLVPLKLANGVVVTPVTTITSNTSTTKRGSRSAVIKVEIPYTALTKDTEGNLTTDPTRSGGALSMHVVVALPAAATKDLQGVNGTDAQRNAEAQVALVNFLLQTLVGKQFGSMPTWTQYLNEGPAIKGAIWPKHMAGPAVGLDIHEIPQQAEVAPVPETLVGGYDGVGFDLTKVRVYKGLNSALSRIANNLPALSCADVTPDTQDLAWSTTSVSD